MKTQQTLFHVLILSFKYHFAYDSMLEEIIFLNKFSRKIEETVSLKKAK